MLLLQIGQCGIQLGAALENELLDVNAKSAVGSFVNAQFGSLLADTEHKSWSTSESTSARKLNIRRVVDGGRLGRGNVWTFGFGTDPDNVMYGVRLFMERYSPCRGFVLIHSVGGGTGSGFGSKIMQLLRETYPEKPIWTVSVLPFASGDAPLQSYNALLSLSYAQRYSDVVSVLSNDQLLKSASSNSEHTGKLSAQNMVDLNAIAAKSVCRVLSPIFDSKPSLSANATNWMLTGVSARKVNLWDVIQSVTPLPSHKLVTFATTASRKNGAFSGWSYLSGQVTDQLRSECKSFSMTFPELEPAILSSQLYVRGFQSEAARELERLEKPVSFGFKRKSQYNPFPIDFVLSSYLEPSLTFLYNSNLVLRPVCEILEKARKMYDKRAYIHWYEKYSASGDSVQDIFDSAFDEFDTMISHYSDL